MSHRKWLIPQQARQGNFADKGEEGAGGIELLDEEGQEKEEEEVEVGKQF